MRNAAHQETNNTIGSGASVEFAAKHATKNISGTAVNACGAGKYATNNMNIVIVIQAIRTFAKMYARNAEERLGMRMLLSIKSAINAPTVAESLVKSMIGMAIGVDGAD